MTQSIIINPPPVQHVADLDPSLLFGTVPVMHVFNARVFAYACLLLLVAVCIFGAPRACTWAAVLSLYYLGLFSNLVPFNMRSLLCPTSWNVSAATWTPHSANTVCFPFSAPLLWWIEPPSHWNVCHNKSIPRRRGNAFERLCVLVRGGLGEHTGMSYVPSWHEQDSLECE